jgi:hypothetical protein
MRIVDRDVVLRGLLAAQDSADTFGRQGWISIEDGMPDRTTELTVNSPD